MIQKLKIIYNYWALLVKYAVVKHNNKKFKIENKNLTNKVELLNKNLEYEKERTKTFRRSYRKKLNDYEELAKLVRDLERKWMNNV